MDVVIKNFQFVNYIVVFFCNFEKEVLAKVFNIFTPKHLVSAFGYKYNVILTLTGTVYTRHTYQAPGRPDSYADKMSATFLKLY